MNKKTPLLCPTTTTAGCLGQGKEELMAKRTPISRSQANLFLAGCLNDEENGWTWPRGDMTYCCRENPQTLETTCVGCKNDESQCYFYEFFRGVSEVMNYARISSDASLAPPDVEPTEPDRGHSNDIVGRLVGALSEARSLAQAECGCGGGANRKKGGEVESS